MKKLVLLNILCLGMVLPYTSQNEVAGMCHDKHGNIFCAGSFTSVMDCGNANSLRALGGYDLFVARYESTGVCTWAVNYGGANSEKASALCVDANGNTYITGTFNGNSRFKHLRISAAAQKSYPSDNFYLLKLNTSGDPVWVKSSQNDGADEGYVICSDAASNIYVAGVFEDKFICDGNQLVSNGKSDLFVMKLNSLGQIIWLKKYGDQEDNNCSAICLSGDMLLLGSSRQENAAYKAVLLCLNPGSGELKWRQELGNKKGSIESICLDENKSVIVSGYSDSKNSTEAQELLLAKYSTMGELLWERHFTGGFPVGKALACDQKNTIYLSGSVSDSIRLDKLQSGAYAKEDIFLAAFNQNGVAQKLLLAGNDKYDRAHSLWLYDTKLWLGGTFTDGITFNKLNAKGNANTAFAASFDAMKLNCLQLKILANEADGIDNPALTDIYGKLLIGSSPDKSFLSDQPLHLEDQNGVILKKTMTDENGDFSFKNIDGSANLNLVIEKNDRLKENDEIYLATQTGLILDKMSYNDQKFKYRIINADIVKMQEMPEENIELKFQEFGGNGGKEFMVTERISYEPNSWTIPAESLPYLRNLAQQMKRYSRMRLEIHSHTDALGDEEFNKKLSLMRAEEVRDFLVKNKVPQNRLTVIGHGEENILNRCTDNIKCSESEHAFNRRTEFRFYLGAGL